MLRALGIALRYIISYFWTHKPLILTHSVTSRCNCRCKICDVWRRKYNVNELSTNEIFRALNEAKKLNFVAYVAWGGEPLMRPDILDILQYAHDLGFYTSIVTNGFYLQEKGEKIAKFVDLTWVSLDHYSSYHDEMRGLKGTFNRALKGMRKVRNAGGRIAINCVLSKLNRDVVGKMAELAHRLGVKIAFDPMEVFPGINEEYALTVIERRRLFSEVLEFKKNGYSILNSHEYLEHLIRRVKYSCLQPRTFIMVTEDGKIKPFWCQKTSRVLGDLRKQSLSEVLFSRYYKRFTEIANECNLCNNSATAETSILYKNNPTRARRYFNLLLNYAL